MVLGQILKTKKQAKLYAAEIESLTGKRHVVFKVPKGTAAYEMGYRYATCEETEREDYEAGGATFVD